MQLRLIFFILLLFTSKIAAAQPNNLYELDSIAFTALESNDADVEEKANALLEAGRRENASISVINALTILGIVNKNKGYYVTSVDFYNQALDVAQKANDSGRVSACYNNIGAVYQIQENFEKALDYFQKSLVIEEKLDNPLQRSIRLYNIGDMYREMDSLSLALSHFNNSLLIEKNYRNKEGIVYALLGISDVYLKLGKSTDARLSLEEIDRYYDGGDVEIDILYNIHYATLCREQGKYQKARTALRKARKISEENDFKIYLPDILEEEIAFSELANKQSKDKEKNGNTFDSKWLLTIVVVLALIGRIVARTIANRKNSKDDEKHKELQKQSDSNSDFILKNDAGKILLYLNVNRIIAFEANDNYVITYYLSDDNVLQKSMDRVSLKKVEELINQHDHFFRVHKSHIINKKFVHSIGGKSQAYKIKMSFVNSEVPVSRSFDISQISA